MPKFHSHYYHPRGLRAPSECFANVDLKKNYAYDKMQTLEVGDVHKVTRQVGI